VYILGTISININIVKRILEVEAATSSKYYNKQQQQPHQSSNSVAVV